MSTKHRNKQNNTKLKRKKQNSLCTYNRLARKMQIINKIEPGCRTMI